MAALTSGPWRAHPFGLVALLASLCACDESLLGLRDDRLPLATLRVRLKPGFDTSDMLAPRVAVVYGAQRIGESFCFAALLADDPSLTAVAAAGCADPLGFVPSQAGPSAPLEADGSANIPLYDLPSASVMVGGLSARVAYASVVLYDDRDRDDRLSIVTPRWRGGISLGRSRGTGEASGPGEGGDPAGGGAAPEPVEGQDEPDERPLEAVHAASFVSMTRPDVRLSYREGAFVPSAFYPRQGCPPPPAGYALLASDGFTLPALLGALAQGALPMTSSCAAKGLEEGVVELAREATATLRGVACAPGNSYGGAGESRYRAPPASAPWLATLPWTCQRLDATGSFLGGFAKFPGQGGDKPGTQRPRAQPRWQLSVAYPAESCRAVRHFVLRGCRTDPDCASPEWDLEATPPLWWPCTQEEP